MAFEPSDVQNSRSIMYLANYPSRTLPTVFTDEPTNLATSLVDRCWNTCLVFSQGASPAYLLISVRGIGAAKNTGDNETVISAHRVRSSFGCCPPKAKDVELELVSSYKCRHGPRFGGGLSNWVIAGSSHFLKRRGSPLREAVFEVCHSLLGDRRA